jgi:ectoine hydroxylase-related dioxygenase (phytanoyl-CoA dioxygenase family)
MTQRSGETADPGQWRERLSQEGYCVMPRILRATALAALRERFSDVTLSSESKDNFGTAGAFIVADYRDPVLVDLLTWPKTLDVLAQLGYPKPKLYNYYVSTKPPGAEALSWHSDLFYAYDKVEPAELFLIYYLQDTGPDNGCLRVVPGSHQWPRVRREAQPHNATIRSDEVDVSIRAGDLFIGDRRILYATHANASDGWRTCLTIAYAPGFAALPEPVQALIVQNQCLPPRGWWDEPNSDIDPRLQAILPIYDGEAAPINTG